MSHGLMNFKVLRGLLSAAGDAYLSAAPAGQVGLLGRGLSSCTQSAEWQGASVR